VIASSETSPTTTTPLLRVKPDERLDLPAPLKGRRFLLLFVACLLIHALILFFLIIEDRIASAIPTPEEEISVEVVNEPPPQQQQAEQPPPPAPEQKPPEPPGPEKKPQPKPPQEKLTLDEKPAYDAPRAENKEKLDREAPDDATKAQKLAQPNEQTAPTPDPRVKQPQQESAPQPAQEPDATAPQEEDKREAEVVEQAPKQGAKTDKKPTKPDPKAVVGEKQKSISDMVASLAPVPDFQIGGAAKTAPITGGTAKPTYLSVVLGYIKRQFHPVEAGRSADGIITFYVDPEGHLVHQALRQSSGSPALDQAAMTALRHAGPFPPTPTATSIGLIWKY
jgi:protein TonB